MKRLTVFLAVLLLATGIVPACGAESDVQGGMEMPPYFSIDQAGAMRMMSLKDGHVVVDVRRPDEYEAGHIPGAILIPVESIGEEPPAELPDTEQIILIYCRSGRRAKEAAWKLGEMGYWNVYEFGGIETWPGEIVAGKYPYGDEEDAGSQAKGHYAFNPKVCSSFMEEVFGQTMCETWFNLVDAVMAGEDTFACPDQHTYDWVMGQFPDRCFPVLTQLIDYAWDRENSVKDGVASFTYRVAKDEAAARIEEFAGWIEDILNENLEDDYSDFEKAMALYQYFARTYTYDYATAEYNEGYPEWLCSYRVFATGTGICQEFSVAYAYLLLQVGIDASVMSGRRPYDGEHHQWTYVKLYGHQYHIDPTYVVGNGLLDYFMMDDGQREAADGYVASESVITSHYSKDHPHPDYAADDDTFRPIWGYTFEWLDHESGILSGWRYGEGWTLEHLEFDYSGY